MTAATDRPAGRAGLDDAALARELALDLDEGMYVNLGIGLPSLVAGALPAGREVVFHCENGVLGMGPRPGPADEDPNLIDAGKQPITLREGGCFMDHADSFALIRGGHLDLAVMGAFEVSGAGDLANWSTGTGIPAVGGAMDLAVGAEQLWVMMRHTTSGGRPKLVEACSLPVTAPGVVTRVYTDLGIFELGAHGLVARAMAADLDVSDVIEATGCPLHVPCGCVSLPRPSAPTSEDPAHEL